MSPFRILQIVTKMDRGGIETMLMNYYRNIDRDKVQFDFLTHRYENGEYEIEIESMGGKIYRLPAFNFRNILKNTLQTEKFFRLNKEYKVVHSHIDALSAFPLMAAKNAGVSVRIAHAHTTDFDKDYKYIIRQCARALLIKKANYFFACTSNAAKFMFGDKIFAEQEYFILNNAIDADSFVFDKEKRALYREQERLRGKFVIGHIGRLSYPKNHEFLIDVFHEVYKREKNAVLFLIGKGEDESRIRDKVKLLGLSDFVRFLGVCADIPKLMQAMDVFVLPSKFEGMPLTLIEAQAAGLKCFVSEDAVSPEAKVTKLLRYVSLKESPQYWARQILNQRIYKREDTRSLIRKSGYDVKQEASKLQAFYLKFA